MNVGDKVRVTNPHPESKAYAGRVGVVYSLEDRDDCGYDVTVCFDGKLKTWWLGVPGFTAEELSRA